MVAKMAVGIVKSYNEKEGVGYIQVSESDDIFFHHSDLQDNVVVGDRVEFDITEGDRSKQAVYIHKTS